MVWSLFTWVQRPHPTAQVLRSVQPRCLPAAVALLLVAATRCFSGGSTSAKPPTAIRSPIMIWSGSSSQCDAESTSRCDDDTDGWLCTAASCAFALVTDESSNS